MAADADAKAASSDGGLTGTRTVVRRSAVAAALPSGAAAVGLARSAPVIEKPGAGKAASAAAAAKAVGVIGSLHDDILFPVMNHPFDHLVGSGIGSTPSFTPSFTTSIAINFTPQVPGDVPSL